MNIISFELSTSECSIAVGNSNQIISESSWQEHGRSSRSVFFQLRKLFSETQCPPDKIDCFIAGIGPGIFSGLRIAVSIADGLAIPGKNRVYGINSSLSVAFHHFGDSYNGNVIVCGDARRDHIWYHAFKFSTDDIVEISPCMAYPASSWPEALPSQGTLLSSDWLRIADQLSGIVPSGITKVEQPVFPSASASIKVALNFMRKGMSLPDPIPVYLHPPVRSDFVLKKEG